uniref:Regulatory protein zeste n=1 Tax=Globodera rostochiensis TaxID=31243 RepID=A0A914HWJ9_GLORO
MWTTESPAKRHFNREESIDIFRSILNLDRMIHIFPSFYQTSLARMKGKTNMPLEAVLALVHMVKARQQELRNHTKLDAASGWTVRNQTWHEITTELNIRYGRELTVDQCMKKLLNIKSMTRYKLEDQERKRKRPGMEQFEVKLTPAEREYIRLFYHGAPPNPPVPGSASWEHIQMLLGGDLPMQSFSLPSTGRESNGGRVDGISLLKDEFLGEEDEVFEIGDDEGEDSLPDERPSQIESVAQTSTALRGQRHLKRGKWPNYVKFAFLVGLKLKL